MCSNVPEFNQPRCFVSSGDTSDLIELFVEYLLKISHASYTSLLEKYSKVFEQIDVFFDNQTDIEDDDEKSFKKVERKA